ncbi:MAG TPA: permease-like cell division protein FtsX [Rhodanobacteraceae bacterium]|nr:permease-like cell division protein FtsX [Rhodanobacteraceae bacterium]
MNARAAAPVERPATARRRPRRMAAWREQHAWCCAASMQRLARRPFGTLLTVLVMGFALALPLAFWLVLGNLEQIASNLGRTQAVNVFMQAHAKASAVTALAARVRQRDDVGAVSVRTPDQGLKELASMQGFANALGALDYNPLPYVLVIEPREHAPAAAVDALVAALRGMPGVDQVRDDGTWRQRLDTLVDLGRRVMAVLAVLLAMAALLVIGNSVRQDIRSRAEEIAVLKLVGASHGFVRRPFLYAGLWYGLAGGVVAAILVLAMEAAVAAPVARLATSYGGRLQVAGLAWWQLLLAPLVAAALGWLGARVVSARWLRRAP